MTADLYVSLSIFIVTCGAIYLYLNGKLRTTALNGVLLVVLLFDMWRVDARPMVYSDKSQLQEEFTKPDFVSFIQQDSSLYRVIQLQNLAPQYSNNLSYYSLQNAYGYTGAKLRNYQDMMDVAGITNPNVLRLLGVKYIISDKPDNQLGEVVFHGSQLVLRDDNVLPRAFFVSNCRVASDLTILQSLRDATFDPAKTALLGSDLHMTIDPPDSQASVSITDYKLQSMTMQARATGNNFLLISEIYYPKGWEATIDGRPTEIYKSDYFLRGVVVPKGVHTVRLTFHPNTYFACRGISLGTNIALLVAIFGIAGYAGFSKRRNRSAEKPPSIS